MFVYTIISKYLFIITKEHIILQILKTMSDINMLKRNHLI